MKEDQADYRWSVKISCSCSICNRETQDDEPLVNPMGDKNWYCSDCWFQKTGERLESKKKKKKKYIPSFSLEVV